MKTLHLVTVILTSGIAILFMLSVSNQLNISEKQISKEQCMGGPYCGGGMPPSASLGNRIIEVALKLYSNSTMPSNTHFVWFRFFDANTNQTIHHVSFFLVITKQNQLLLKELLHTHTGMLTLQLNSINETFNGTVVGDHEPILNGWMPYNDYTPLIIFAPVFNDTNSTYHFEVQMFSIDRDNNIFSNTDIPNGVPTFNFYLNMKEKDQTMISPNVTVPEFPVSEIILIISIILMIALYKIEFQK